MYKITRYLQLSFHFSQNNVLLLLEMLCARANLFLANGAYNSAVSQF